MRLENSVYAALLKPIEKQHLSIRKFLDKNENAIQLQL
jgi:hypothetical protein